MGALTTQHSTDRRQQPRYALRDSLSVRFHVKPGAPSTQLPHDALVLDVSEHGALLMTSHHFKDEQQLLISSSHQSEQPLPAAIRHIQLMYDSSMVGILFSEDAAAQFWSLVSEKLGTQL